LICLTISDKVNFLSPGTQQGLLYCALTNMEAYRWVWSHTDMVLYLSDQVVLTPTLSNDMDHIFFISSLQCEMDWAKGGRSAACP
jgi:hypothetical protein